jgi:hypothetical protein
MKTAVEKALENLQQKRKHFIGNHRDSSSIAETKGFLQGLDWAIDTIETAIENESCKEEWRKVPTAKEVIEKMVKFASVNDTINCTVYSLSDVMIDFAKLHVEAALKAASESESDGVPFGRMTYPNTILTCYPLENIN